MPAALVTRRPALTGCLTMYPGLPLNRVPLSRVPFCHTHTQAHSVTMYPGYPLNCATLSSVPFCHTHTDSDNVPGIATEPCPIVMCTLLSHTHTGTQCDNVPGISTELCHTVKCTFLSHTYKQWQCTRDCHWTVSHCHVYHSVTHTDKQCANVPGISTELCHTVKCTVLSHTYRQWLCTRDCCWTASLWLLPFWHSLSLVRTEGIFFTNQSINQSINQSTTVSQD